MSKKKRRRQKPDHYSVVSVTLYRDDIERLDRMVEQLKQRGRHKMNRSMLVRWALSRVDVDDVPEPM